MIIVLLDVVVVVVVVVVVHFGKVVPGPSADMALTSGGA